VKIQDRNGQIIEIKIKKPQVLAIPIFMAKLGKYANKDHKLISFECDDSRFLEQIMPSLPISCETGIIREE
jgi:hypothetical protein